MRTIEHGPGQSRSGRGFLLIYSGLLTTALVVGLPWWLLRIATRPRYRAGLAQRLGRLSPELRGLRGSERTIWLHAVSVGEVLAAAALVESLRRRQPELPRLLISTTTEAGQRLARERFPREVVFYLPLDFRLLMRRVFRAGRPRLLLLLESELWPNLLAEARRADCRVAVVNARISDRSFPRYWRLRRLWRPILRQVDRWLAQGAETAERLEQLGIQPERIEITGNLKYDLQPARRGRMVAALDELRQKGLRLVVAGSTLEGEEALLLRAWRVLAERDPMLRLVIAPRHPARFEAVARQAMQAGLAVWRLSEVAEIPMSAQVLLLDTIGDLAGVYALATLAFVGGSLVPAGGHNPLEPARFGVPVVMGPSFENFREIVHTMQRNDAVLILAGEGGSDALARQIEDLLGDAEQLAQMGGNAARVVLRESGAADRTAEAVLALLAPAVPV